MPLPGSVSVDQAAPRVAADQSHCFLPLARKAADVDLVCSPSHWEKDFGYSMANPPSTTASPHTEQDPADLDLSPSPGQNLSASASTSASASASASASQAEDRDRDLPLVEPCGMLPVSKTFIHFDVAQATEFNIFDTAPAEMLQAPFQTKWPAHEAMHARGECRPCAYHFKPDGCRWGAQCEFCHLCPKSEIKARKKEKVRALRRQEQMVLQQRLLATATMRPKTGATVADAYAKAEASVEVNAETEAEAETRAESWARADQNQNQNHMDLEASPAAAAAAAAAATVAAVQRQSIVEQEQQENWHWNGTGASTAVAYAFAFARQGAPEHEIWRI